MDITAKLNLTRKWRSKTFDAIVGQSVTVRILKNSLFLDQIFPVYLFSGQRGCGKTTTARVFTAALNCSKLADFRQNPKQQSVPCLACSSCLAMAEGRHPDFTEIDAASHTGVDNIRQLIEASYLMPLLGQRKIYLIDEVHMLSKAAFNALLKILEEPPLNVVFILATTDPHKVLETVKSRSFQLFFGPPPTADLLQHLQQICEHEQIVAEPAALQILMRESEGSIRDAMNLLDQVRFAGTQVTVETVSQVLGHVSDQQLLQLLDLTLSGNTDLPNFLQQLNLAGKNIEFIWRRLSELFKYILYAKHGVRSAVTQELQLKIQDLANKFELRNLINFLDRITRQEQYLLKSAAKSLALELFLLQGLSVRNEPVTDKLVGEVRNESNPVVESVGVVDHWQRFVGLLSQCGDPILISVFQQARFKDYDAKLQQVSLELGAQNHFLAELIKDQATIWQPLLRQVFDNQAELVISYAAEAAVEANKPVISKPSGSVKSTGVTTRSGKVADVSDRDQWPLANAILDAFPGQIYEVSDE